MVNDWEFECVASAPNSLDCQMNEIFLCKSIKIILLELITLAPSSCMFFINVIFKHRFDFLSLSLTHFLNELSCFSRTPIVPLLRVWPNFERLVSIVPHDLGN